MSKQFRYRAIREPVRGQFTVAGSRFIATMSPAGTEPAARAVLDSVKSEFPDATHHAYAYRLGAGAALIERAGDDREPAGTAGLPMLQVLKGALLGDVIVVGTRYFGGVKLGIGGLTRAYRDCARFCLEQAVVVELEQRTCYRISLPYEAIGAVSRHIETLGGEIISVDYGAAVTLLAAVSPRLAAALRQGLADLSKGRCRWEECGTENRPSLGK